MTLALDTPAPVRPLLTEFARKDRAVVGPWADAGLIYGAPIWALLFIGAFQFLPGQQTQVGFGGTNTLLAFTAAVVTYAHLLPVFVRSHLNPQIFAAHRLKLMIVPPLLFATLAISKEAFIVAGVIGSFWDVYHTAQQNFGLARIYHTKSGAKADVGRGLDRMLCHAMYLGPIAAGASFIPTLSSVSSFEQIGVTLFTTLPHQVEGVGGVIRTLAIGVVIVAIAVYLVGQWRLHRQGVPLSPHKIALLSVTSAVNIIAWGFCPPAIAFMAVNIYHAMQYFGIVWRQEAGKAPGHIGVTGESFKRPAAIAMIIAIPALYGMAAVVFHTQWSLMAALFLSVSLLHFWMDGFIWSVRKKTV